MTFNDIDQYAGGFIDSYPMSSIEQLERSFCTNFSCCNVLFRDLHALLDHTNSLEHSHALQATLRAKTPLSLVVTPCSSSPATSPPSSPTSTGSCSPLASYSSPEGSPLPRTPLELHSSPVSPSTFAACSTSSLNSTFSDLELADLPSPWAVPFVYRHPGTNNYALADYPTYEHCYDAAISVLPTTPTSKQNVNVFAAATTGSVTTPITPQPQGPSGDRAIGDNNLGEKGRRGVPDSGSQGDAKKTTTTTSEPNYNIRKYAGKRKGKVDLHGAPLAATRKRSKKAYQCPTPGCTKSYLNPNGLKYHQEKGTCKIESPASSPATRSSPLPPMQQASPISSNANPYPPPRSPLSSKEVPTHEIASTVLPPPPSPSSLLLQHHLLATIHQPQPRHALMHWATASASAASSLNSSTHIAASASAGLGGGVKAM